MEWQISNQALIFVLITFFSCLFFLQKVKPSNYFNVTKVLWDPDFVRAYSEISSTVLTKKKPITSVFNHSLTQFFFVPCEKYMQFVNPILSSAFHFLLCELFVRLRVLFLLIFFCSHILICGVLAVCLTFSEESCAQHQPIHTCCPFSIICFLFQVSKDIS